MAFYEFPHTRTYDSDLGWLIEECKKVSGDYDSIVSWMNIHQIEYNNLKSIVDTLTSNMLNVINPWDGTKEYSIYTIVSYNGDNYIALQDVPAGVLITDTNYWDLANTVISQVNAIAASVSDILKSLYVYTPERFGAAGDGVTDDSAAFSLALSACVTDGYKLYLGNKTYKVHDVAIPGNIEIIGGTLKPDIVSALTNQYTNLFTGSNVSIVFRNVHFTGVGPALLATPTMYHYMKFTECKLEFYGCEWDDIHTLNTNLSTVPFIDRFGVLLTAIDCEVKIKNCYIHNLSREENIWICPTSDTFYNIDFSENIIENVNGWSFNFFGNTVSVKQNFIKDFISATSIFNINAHELIADSNVFEHCSTVTCFDCSESGFLFVDVIHITNNVYHDTGSYLSALADCRTYDLLVSGNSGEMRYLVDHNNNYSSSAQSVVPWTIVGNYDANNAVIKDNSIKIGQSGNNQILPVISILGSKYYSDFGTGIIENVVISGNNITFSTSATIGPFRYSCVCLSTGCQKTSIENNNFINMRVGTIHANRVIPVFMRSINSMTARQVSVINNRFEPASDETHGISPLQMEYNSALSTPGVGLVNLIVGYNSSIRMSTNIANANATITNNLTIQTA